MSAAPQPMPTQPAQAPTPGQAAPQPIRIGAAEREAAIAALGEHMAAGRLEPDEYGDRVAQASIARYEADLAPLFADLPALVPSTARSAMGRRIGDAAAEPGAPLFGHVGLRLVSLAPLVALVLFFVLIAAGIELAWLAFFLVPATAIAIRGDRRQHRDWRRQQRQVQRHRRQQERQASPAA
jgi:hypothetical protein